VLQAPARSVSASRCCELAAAPLPRDRGALSGRKGLAEPSWQCLRRRGSSWVSAAGTAGGPVPPSCASVLVSEGRCQFLLTEPRNASDFHLSAQAWQPCVSLLPSALPLCTSPDSEDVRSAALLLLLLPGFFSPLLPPSVVVKSPLCSDFFLISTFVSSSSSVLETFFLLQAAHLLYLYISHACFHCLIFFTSPCLFHL